MLDALRPRSSPLHAFEQRQFEMEEKRKLAQRVQDTKPFHRSWSRLANLSTTIKLELVPVCTNGKVSVARAAQQSEYWLEMFLWYTSGLDGNTLMKPVGVTNKLTLKRCYLDEVQRLMRYPVLLEQGLGSLPALAEQVGWTPSMSTASDASLHERLDTQP